jgi:hypothetical protein
MNIEKEFNELIDNMVDHIFRAELNAINDPSERFIISIQEETQEYRNKAEIILTKIKELTLTNESTRI